ncbi:MAG: protoporphyrinogen oxidase [Rhodothermales bacterium]
MSKLSFRGTDSSLEATGHRPGDIGNAAPVMRRPRPRTVIVGGGISGLAAGCFLDRTGTEILVLEASSRTGGVIESRTIDGHLVELGPQRTRLSKPLQQLVEWLGISDRLVTAPELPLYIYSRGRLRQAPLDLRTALSTDLISWADRLRVLMEPFTAGLDPDESAADYFIRKFGRGTYRRAIAPLFGDLYGSDPAEMPARHALATMLRALRIDGSLLRVLIQGLRSERRPPACSFSGGLQTLTDAMAARLGERVRAHAAVRAIFRDGPYFRVVTDEDEVLADRVVLSCPAAPAARATVSLDADLSNRLADLRYNTFAVVHLESNATFKGTGYQFALETGYATRGVTANGALFDRPGLFTAFLGGATHQGVTQLSEEHLGAIAASEFRAVTGFDARPLAVHQTYMPAWDGSWNRLDDLRLPDGVHLCANWIGRPGITGRINEAAALTRELTMS